MCKCRATSFARPTGRQDTRLDRPLCRRASVSHRAFVRTASMVLCGLAFMSASAAEEPVDLTLYQTFGLARAERWSAATLRLAPESWRVGSVAGPAATQAQLAATLRSMKAMAIAARCQLVQQPPTFYPCTLELQVDEPHAGAGTRPGQAAIPSTGWSATSGYLLRRFAQRTVAATFFPGAPGNAIDLGLGPDHFGLIAPPALLEQFAMPELRQFVFRVRVVPSPLAVQQGVNETGVFVLSTKPMPGAAPVKPDAIERT